MYGKLFEIIFSSSIMEEDLPTRYLWQCLIGLANRDGIVDMTLTSLAAKVRLPVNTVSKALTCLSQPDPESRSKEYEGRRIIKLDEGRSWGWVLVNYPRYRDLRSQSDRRAYMREYMRKRRAVGAPPEKRVSRKANVNSLPSLQLTPLANASVSVSEEKNHPPLTPPASGRGTTPEPKPPRIRRERRQRRINGHAVTEGDAAPPDQGPDSYAAQIASRALAAADAGAAELEHEDGVVVLQKWRCSWPLRDSDRENLQRIARGER